MQLREQNKKLIKQHYKKPKEIKEVEHPKVHKWKQKKVNPILIEFLVNKQSELYNKIRQDIATPEDIRLYNRIKEMLKGVYA